MTNDVKLTYITIIYMPCKITLFCAGNSGMLRCLRTVAVIAEMCLPTGLLCLKQKMLIKLYTNTHIEREGKRPKSVCARDLSSDALQA